MRSLITLFACASMLAVAAEPEFPLTEDSKPNASVPKGEMIKGSYTAREGSVFPGTGREYQIYLPHGLDKTKSAPFMVFQDGVIYQAPVVFDNLIAKKDIPPLVGIFIKPGVVPAAHDNALPRFNRSYEYDSVTDTYAAFLIDEFLPAIEKTHGLNLSTDPNRAAIAGNSSGGICAFMVAWHRPDRFRRVFTGVGTYVGIRGADQLPVLVRKIEPKPLRVFLQSGTGDNNLYCGDWWMANQMMERSLTWAGYDVNHAWGEGGHNQKHASQIFPDVLRWLWRGWQTDVEVKANPKRESKWKGYEVVGGGTWVAAHAAQRDPATFDPSVLTNQMEAMTDGSVYVGKRSRQEDASAFVRIDPSGRSQDLNVAVAGIEIFTPGPNGELLAFIGSASDARGLAKIVRLDANGKVLGKTMLNRPGPDLEVPFPRGFCCDSTGRLFYSDRADALIGWITGDGALHYKHGQDFDTPTVLAGSSHVLCLSPDQTQLYVGAMSGQVAVFRIGPDPLQLQRDQMFYLLESLPWLRDIDPYTETSAMCVDTDGRLYVATAAGIQVCDQAGRVNFIIPTPKQPYDLCFGGANLSELFIACGDTIYKRPTNVHGIVSGQQPPIKPAPPKL